MQVEEHSGHAKPHQTEGGRVGGGVFDLGGGNLKKSSASKWLNKSKFIVPCAPHAPY